MVTGHKPFEAAARIKSDTMPSALQLADRNLFRAEFLSAIDWALSPSEDQRPQSVAEWRAALLGTSSIPEKTQLLPKTAAVPSFEPALLTKLEAALAQHLGPIAPVVVKKAAKKAGSQAELVQLVAAEIGDGDARATFERKFLEISRPQSQPRSGPHTTSQPATSAAASRFPLEVLERAEQRLAEHIGAVARVVVKRAAMKARDEAELYLLVADEIEDKDEKKAFTRKAVSVFRKS